MSRQVNGLQLAYLGVEVADPVAFGTYLTDVVGISPGPPTSDGLATFTNDSAVHRLLVADGPSNDATFVGLEAADQASLLDVVARLNTAGFEVTDDPARAAVRGVSSLHRVQAPWGVPIDLITGLARHDQAPTPLVPGGFHTDGVGFGHLVFATTEFDETHRFIIDGLGFNQTDWLELELAPGLQLEIRFYHCNPRHHTIAVARAPFAMPAVLHHLMVETNDVDDVGHAFDRAWNAGVEIANGLGKHGNDRMFSFYAVTPAGFQLEIGSGARTVGDDWDDNRKYDAISIWGHQPLVRPAG